MRPKVTFRSGIIAKTTIIPIIVRANYLDLDKWPTDMTCMHQQSLVNSFLPGAAYMRHWVGSALVQIMACRLFGAKPLPEPMLSYYQLDP